MSERDDGETFEALDARFGPQLGEAFAGEDDAAGMKRMLDAVRSGDDGALTDEESAIVAFDRRIGSEVHDPFTDEARGAWRPLLAAAAALLIGLGIWWALGDRPVPELRVMGGDFDLHVAVSGPDGPVPVGDAPLPAGAALGLGYSSPVDGHLRVFALDADGAGILHPLDPSSAVRAGERVLLPAGATLTAGDGCEWIVALFSTAPIEADAAQRAVADARDLDPTDGCALGPIELADLQVRAVRIPR